MCLRIIMYLFGYLTCLCNYLIYLHFQDALLYMSCTQGLTHFMLITVQPVHLIYKLTGYKNKIGKSIRNIMCLNHTHTIQSSTHGLSNELHNVQKSYSLCIFES